MKKIILINIILCFALNGKGIDFKNPNGEPFLLTLSFGQTELGSGYGLILPLSKWVSLKTGKYHTQKSYGGGFYVFSGNPADDNFGSVDCSNECDGGYGDNFSFESHYVAPLAIEHKYFILDVHVPIFKLWKK